jgi:hypothetical protein
MLVIHPSPHPEALTHPSHPKVFRIKERTPTPFSVVFIFELTFESFKEFGGASMHLSLLTFQSIQHFKHQGLSLQKLT